MRKAIRGRQAVVFVASRAARQSRYASAALDVAAMYRRPIYPVWVEGRRVVDRLHPIRLGHDAVYRCARPAVRCGGGGTRRRTARREAGFRRRESEQGGVDGVGKPRTLYKGLRAFAERVAGDFLGPDVQWRGSPGGTAGDPRAGRDQTRACVPSSVRVVQASLAWS